MKVYAPVSDAHYSIGHMDFDVRGGVVELSDEDADLLMRAFPGGGFRTTPYAKTDLIKTEYDASTEVQPPSVPVIFDKALGRAIADPDALDKLAAQTPQPAVKAEG